MLIGLAPTRFPLRVTGDESKNMKKIGYAGGRLEALIAANSELWIPYSKALAKLKKAGGVISRDNGRSVVKMPSGLLVGIPPRRKSLGGREYQLQLVRGEPRTDGRILALFTLSLKLSPTQSWITGNPKDKDFVFSDPAGEVARVFGFDSTVLVLDERVIWLPVPGDWIRIVGSTGMLMNESVYGITSLALFKSDAVALQERFVRAMAKAINVPLQTA